MESTETGAGGESKGMVLTALCRSAITLKVFLIPELSAVVTAWRAGTGSAVWLRRGRHARTPQLQDDVNKRSGRMKDLRVDVQAKCTEQNMMISSC